jgi:hypothetical protein
MRGDGPAPSVEIYYLPQTPESQKNGRQEVEWKNDAVNVHAI